jgi:predicted NAD/FAD-binding protein
MNMPQNLAMPKDICVSLNIEEHLGAIIIIKRIIYEHPVFSIDAIWAQKNTNKLMNTFSI